MESETTPIAYRHIYVDAKSDSPATIRIEAVYYDQFYKLPFWLNMKLKLKRWTGL